MSFGLSCNQCGKAIQVDDDQVGSMINCPACGQVIFVQSPSPSATPPVAVAPPIEIAPATESVPVDSPQGTSPVAATQTIPLAAESPHSEVNDFLQSLSEPRAPAASGASLISPDDESNFPETNIFVPGEPEHSFFAPATAGPEPFASLADDAIQAGSPVASSSVREGDSVPAPIAASASELSVPEFPWLTPDATPPDPERTAIATAFTPSAPESFFIPIAPVSAPPAAAAAIQAAESAPTDFITIPKSAATGDSATPPPYASDRSSSATRPPAKHRSKFGIVVGAYVSGVLMGLILGKLMFGRAPKQAPAASGLEMIRDDGLHKEKTKWPDPKSDVPRSQIKRIGETVQVGGLAVTATAVERGTVTKVHSFSKNKETTEGECLILRLLLKNISKDIEFAPLDPVFLRPHNARERPSYSYIELKDDKPIPMFELHQFSEFDLEGQPFDVLEPGDEIEAIVAAAEGSPGQAKGTMLWRVQLRAGAQSGRSYSTVVGFEFTADQIGG